METIAVIVLLEIIIAINVNILEREITINNPQPIKLSNVEMEIVIFPNKGIPIIEINSINKI